MHLSALYGHFPRVIFELLDSDFRLQKFFSHNRVAPVYRKQTPSDCCQSTCEGVKAGPKCLEQSTAAPQLCSKCA